MLYLFRLRELLCCRELLNCSLARSLATALLAALSSPSPGFRAAPRWFMQVVAGQTEGPCQPCPPVTRDPLPPKEKPPNLPTDRPASDWERKRRSFSSALLKTTTSSPPAACHNRQVKTRPPPVASWGPETWQMGYASRPRAGKMEQHSSPSSGRLVLWVILPAKPPPFLPCNLYRSSLSTSRVAPCLGRACLARPRTSPAPVPVRSGAGWLSFLPCPVPVFCLSIYLSVDRPRHFFVPPSRNATSGQTWTGCRQKKRH